MNRLSFFVLPFAIAAFACNAPASEEPTAGDEADVVGIFDLGTLESSLSLVWDRDRTRPEEVLKDGPCYRKMVASGRVWNMRRYTTGAAFFFEEHYYPHGPLACVDVEQMDGTKDGSGGRQPAVALTGLTLDTAIRFKLGRLQWMDGPQEGPDDGSREMVFESGAIHIQAFPATTASETKDNLPDYDGNFRGVITSIELVGTPSKRLADTMPGAGMLAYRYAKAVKSTSMLTDPLGAFVSIEAARGEVGSTYTLHFERGEIHVLPGAVALATTGSTSTNASCARPGPGQEWQCVNALEPAVEWEGTPQL